MEDSIEIEKKNIHHLNGAASPHFVCRNQFDFKPVPFRINGAQLVDPQRVPNANFAVVHFQSDLKVGTLYPLPLDARLLESFIEVR